MAVDDQIWLVRIHTYDKLHPPFSVGRHVNERPGPYEKSHPRVRLRIDRRASASRTIGTAVNHPLRSIASQLDGRVEHQVKCPNIAITLPPDSFRAVSKAKSTSNRPKR